MKKNILILSFLICYALSWAQKNEVELLELAKTAYDEQNYITAVDYYSKLINRNSNDSYYFNQRGNCYFNQGHYNEAILDYLSALKITPDNKVFIENLAGAYKDAMRYDEAIDVYSLLGEMDKENKRIYNRSIAELYFAKAESEYAAKEYVNALYAYEKVKKYNSEYPSLERKIIKTQKKAKPQLNKSIKIEWGISNAKNNEIFLNDLDIDNALQIKARVVSKNNQALDLAQDADFELFINEKSQKGTKLGNQKLNINRNDIVYQTEINLAKQGDYRLVLKVDKYEVESEEFIVHFTAQKKIHILSIGTKPPDLQYSKKDAEDFSNIYRKNTKSLEQFFQKINIYAPILGTEATAQNVKNRILELKKESISDKDILIIFISAHGFIANNKFYIKGQGFDSSNSDLAYVKNNAINVEEDIKNALADVKCKKVVFLDACHSGGIKGESPNINENVMRELEKSSNELIFITSSSENEVSYEDDSWKNGAFTHTILEGFQKADQDDDNAITVKELFGYLENNLNQKVFEIKQGKQNPKKISTKGDNWLLFYKNN